MPCQATQSTRQPTGTPTIHAQNCPSSRTRRGSAGVCEECPALPESASPCCSPSPHSHTAVGPYLSVFGRAGILLPRLQLANLAIVATPPRHALLPWPRPPPLDHAHMTGHSTSTSLLAALATPLQKVSLCLWLFQPHLPTVTSLSGACC